MKKFRPSHADFTYQAKFGHRNHEGGGDHLRETIARVAAEAIAKKSFPSMACSSVPIQNESTIFNLLHLTKFLHSMKLSHLPPYPHPKTA